MGSDLQDPCGASLPNLSTLLDVSALSCKEAIFEAIANLRKLGIQIDSEPNAVEPLNISNLLKKLRILKCVVVNPEIMSPPSPLPPSFPFFLRKFEWIRISLGIHELDRMFASCYNPQIAMLRLSRSKVGSGREQVSKSSIL